MEKSPNKPWAFGPIIAILLLAAAYYIKVPAFREAVNTRFPWAKEHLGQFVPSPKVVIINDPKPVPAASAGALAAKPAVANANEPLPAPPVPAAAETGSALPTLKDFAANSSLWPKTVRLRAATEFPAVVNGKKVGKLQAPPGTEARLVAVNGEQLGVEFQGGGAWVPDQPDRSDAAGQNCHPLKEFKLTPKFPLCKHPFRN